MIENSLETTDTKYGPIMFLYIFVVQRLLYNKTYIEKGNFFFNSNFNEAVN